MHKTYKKVISFLICIVLITITLASCSSNDISSTEENTLLTETTTELVTDEENFKLSYSQSDTLNPFKCKSQNNQIVNTLVFDSLFYLDQNLEAQPQIATSYTYKDSKTLNLIIKSGIVFSNGKILDANDVVYSFERAKTSPAWKNSLNDISSASAVSSNSITFHLKKSNPNVVKLLTFAICKSGTADNEFPIGSGRYKYSKGSGDTFLVVNDKYEEFTPHFTKITLENISSLDSIENAVNIGNISYAFLDLSDSTTLKINSKKESIQLNNMVYVGYNSHSGITSNKYIRQAISYAMDRDAIARSAYNGYATVCTSPYNPVTKDAKESIIFDKQANQNSALQSISKSGYNNNQLQITILTDKTYSKKSTATLIKQQLESVGFKVKINSLNYKQYVHYVKNKYFDIYVGETKISNDGSLNSFFSNKGSTRYGIKSSMNSKKEYEKYISGKTGIGEFMISFSEDVPFAPILYRKGLICYSSSMHGDMQGYYENYFSNIEDWFYNK